MADPLHRQYMVDCGIDIVGKQLQLEAEVKKLLGEKESPLVLATASSQVPKKYHRLPPVKERKKLLSPAMDRIFRIK